MKKEITMADVLCEIERYGAKRERQGKSKAYAAVLHEAVDLLQTMERYETLDAALCLCAEWVETLEQIAALVQEGE